MKERALIQLDLILHVNFNFTDFHQIQILKEILPSRFGLTKKFGISIYIYFSFYLLLSFPTLLQVVFYLPASLLQRTGRKSDIKHTYTPSWLLFLKAKTIMKSIAPCTEMFKDKHRHTEEQEQNNKYYIIPGQ